MLSANNVISSAQNMVPAPRILLCQWKKSAFVKSILF